MKNLKEAIQEIVKNDISTRKNEKIVIDTESVIYDTVRALHFGLWPRNFIFDTVESVLESCLEYDFETLAELEEFSHEIVDGLVDVYAVSLLDWVKDFSSYVDDAKGEGLITNDTDFNGQLLAGQFYHIQEIFNALVSDINDSLEVE